MGGSLEFSGTRSLASRRRKSLSAPARLFLFLPFFFPPSFLPPPPTAPKAPDFFLPHWLAMVNDRYSGENGWKQG